MSNKPRRAEDWTPEKEAAHRAQYPHWSQYNSLDAAMEQIMTDIEALAGFNKSLLDVVETQGKRIDILERALVESGLFMLDDNGRMWIKEEEKGWKRFPYLDKPAN